MSYPDHSWVSNWFPTVSAALFAGANALMLLAWASGNRQSMILANRLAGFSVPAAMGLLAIGLAQGDVRPEYGIWFTGFAGVPAVAFALTVPLQLGLPWFFFTVGGVTVSNAVLLGRDSWYDLAGEVGFAVINTFAFIIVAAAAMRVARVTDVTEARARRDFARAARMRSRADEMVRFTALIHDHVLAELAAIAKGLKPTGAVDLHFGAGLAGADVGDADSFIRIVSERVRAETPDCRILVLGTPDLGKTGMPEQAMANMVMSLSEIARNSARHAGPGADRRCEISLSPGAVMLRYVDDGPGFDPADVPHTSAGLRVSVHGRMASVDGCAVDVRTAPGEGVDVRLTWTADEPESPVGQLPVGLDKEPVYSILGMNVVFSWQFAVAMATVFTVILLLAAAEAPGLPEFATILLIMIALSLLMPGEHSVLPMPRTVALVVVEIAICMVGPWQQIVEIEGAWNRLVFINAVALIASLLALRGRPLSAVIAVLGAGVVMEILARAGAGNAPDVGVVTVVSFSIIVFAATLVHMGIAYFFRRLPEARAQQHRAEAAAAAAMEAKARRRKNLGWLESEILPVLDAARFVDPPTGQLRERARLTELRLRDVLRSPLLDRPALTSAIWAARARGVTVRLLDDRSGWGDNGDDAVVIADDGIDVRESVDAMLGPAIRAVDDAEPGTEVTIRLLPPGRDSFASISDDRGVVKLPGAAMAAAG